MKNKRKKLPLLFVLLLGNLIALYAGEGVVLYKTEIQLPNGSTVTDVAIDTDGDGLEDTFLENLDPKIAAHISMNRRIKEGSVITFDDKGVYKRADGFSYIIPLDVQTIDGTPARPQNTR